MGHDIDETDRRILSALAGDARLSMRELATRVHVSRANAYTRVERLREAGVIRGYRADVDPVLSGFGTSAYITLNLRQAEWRHVKAHLQRLPGVVHIALVGGEFDVILLVRARNDEELRRLVFDEIQAVPGVVSTRTMLVFDEPASPGVPYAPLS